MTIPTATIGCCGPDGNEPSAEVTSKSNPNDVGSLLSNPVKNSFRLTKKVINNFPVISEVLNCEYKDGYNYATMKINHAMP